VLVFIGIIAAAVVAAVVLVVGHHRRWYWLWSELGQRVKGIPGSINGVFFRSGIEREREMRTDVLYEDGYLETGH
jgi:hypothetical protein